MSVYKSDTPTFLLEALTSIQNQTVICDDICLVCDGQLTNELEEVIGTFKQQLGINIIRLEKNVGLGKALNEGLKHVKHEWVFRMDSDDICLPNRFQIQLDKIKESPGLDIVGGFIEEFEDSASVITSIRKVPVNHLDIAKCMKSFSPFNHVTVAFKKTSVIAAGSYIGGRNFQEDYYLWIRMMKNDCKFANIPKTLVLVRGGSEMLNRRKGWAYYKSEVYVAKKSLEFGIINIWQFLFLMSSKFIIRLSPNFIRKLGYKLARQLLNKLSADNSKG